MLIGYFLIVSILSLVVLFIRWYANYRARYESLSKFPNLTSFVGYLRFVKYIAFTKLEHHPDVYISERILGYFQLNRQHGLHVMWYSVAPIVILYAPDCMEEILGNSTTLEKSFEYVFLHPWLGTGLLTSTGTKWRRRRKLLTPTFHFRILEDFVPTFNEQSLILMEKLRASIGKDYVDINPLITLCTLDIICESVMGVSIGAQNCSDSEYVNSIKRIGELFTSRRMRMWEWSDLVYALSSNGREFNRYLKILHGFTNKVIQEKKAKLLQNADQKEVEFSEDLSDLPRRKRKAFMDLLLDLHVNGNHLSEEDIREEVDTFMFEGHDTTAMGLTYALYCIGLYPKIQDTIMKELEEIFGDDRDRPVTIEDAKKMKYLECVLKESQRLYPSVPIISRKLTEPKTIRGYTIPSGTTVHINIICIHKDPDLYPNPEIFDPERFYPENSTGRHPYAYLPFSAGPRNCIGQRFALLEEKVVISNIMRHFRIVSLDQRDKIHVKVQFTLRPAQPMRLRFIPRTD